MKKLPVILILVLTLLISGIMPVSYAATNISDGRQDILKSTYNIKNGDMFFISEGLKTEEVKSQDDALRYIDNMKKNLIWYLHIMSLNLKSILKIT